MVIDIRAIKLTILSTIYLFYLVATLNNSDYWGNILSPVVAIAALSFICYSFVIKEKSFVNKCIGVLLCSSLFTYIIADILWAVFDLVYHMNPDDNLLITVLYDFTNLFITAALTIYGILVFRRWNIVQMILDSAVMSYLTISLLWVIFLKEDFSMIIYLQSDPAIFASVIMDILIIIWVVLWYVSVREGRLQLYIRFVATGALLYAIADLVYYYQYLYDSYNANSYLDAVYMLAFLLMGIAAVIKMHRRLEEDSKAVINIGRRGKSGLLLLAPLLILLFKGFEPTYITIYLSVILFYYLLSNYIQNNIFKEELLKEEKELSSSLEQKVRERTEELEKYNQVLQRLIDQEPVTGLYNRRYLLAYLEEMSGNLKKDETIVLLYIDMNRYKMLTTMFGHYIGDKILKEMAARLKLMEEQAARCIISSYGDDAFIFAAVGLYDYSTGYRLASEIVRRCSDIYYIDGYQIKVTVNIGISLLPKDAANKDELIKHADIAVTHARMQGLNTIQEFDADISAVFLRRNTIELMMKKVNFSQEFIVYYQPQLETDTRKLIGFEALLRWRTASGSFISPGEFIPIAEETGYIIQIGEWVTKEVLRQMILWNRHFQKNVMISINVSLRQLGTAQFLESLKEEIKQLEIDPEWIDLELTESRQLVENPEVLHELEEIRRLGVKISIDDFGTGYSSLSYFKELPADRIKLAKELIDFIHKDDFDYQLAKSLILLAHARNIRVIAEGVETIEQWETLKELQCDEVQGFYFGQPSPVGEIEAVYGDELSGNL